MELAYELTVTHSDHVLQTSYALASVSSRSEVEASMACSIVETHIVVTHGLESTMGWRPRIHCAK